MSKDNKVEVFVPRGNATEDPNFFISVNGVNYVLPKGKRTKVPAVVAEEYERSKRAADKRDERAAMMADEAAKF